MMYYCPKCRTWRIVASTQGALCLRCHGQMIDYYSLAKRTVNQMNESVNFCLCVLYSFAKDESKEVRCLVARAMRIMMEVNRVIEQKDGDSE